MRLHEVERGDGLISQILIRFLSLMSGMRLPDAARVAFYHKQFSGDSMSAWTHAAMRGESAWSVGERELMAAMTAKWNSCPFCIGAHGAIAARALGRPQVLSTLEDFRQAELSPNLQATLVFLETLTRRPGELTREDAWAVLCKGVTPQALEDAIAVCALFHIMTRCADTLDYRMLSEKDFDRAAKQLLVQGYAFGKGKTPPIPIIVSWPTPCASASFLGRGRPMPPFAKRWQSEQLEARRFRHPTTSSHDRSERPPTKVEYAVHRVADTFRKDVLCVSKD